MAFVKLHRSIVSPVGLIGVVLLYIAMLMGNWQTASAQINTDAVTVIGRNALYYKDYALSIQYFNQVIAAKPRLYAPYYYRAIAKYYLDDYVGSIDDCTMSVERDPYIPEVYRLRAVNYIRTENFTEASRDYYTLIKDFKVKERDVWYNLVLCQSQLDQHAEADRLLDSMIVSWPDYARCYMLKAQIAAVKGDTLRADSLLMRTLELDSADVDAMSVLAMLSIQRGMYDKAETWYSKAIGLSPRNTQFYVNRALARYQQTNLRGAMDDYNAALETNPDNYLAHYNRALLRMHVGENNLAIEDFDFVLGRHPNDRLALYNRAILAQQTGDFERAIKEYTVIIKEFPDFAGAYLNRSYCYERIGDRKRSEADSRRVVQLQLDLAYTKKEAVSPLDSITRDKSDADIEDYDKLVTDESENIAPIYDSEHRGLVQNKKVSEDYQPLYVFTFFKADNGLASTVSNREPFVDRLNAEGLFFAPLNISARELPMTEAQCVEVGESRDSVMKRLQVSPNDKRLRFCHALYLAVERDYEYAAKELADCAVSGKAETDSLDYAIESMFLRSYVKAKQVELQATKASVKPEIARMQNAGAIADLNAAISAKTDCAVLYYNRATLYARDADYERAIADFDKAIELSDEFPEAYYNRGLVHVHNGDKQKGFADLSKAGELGLFTAYGLIKHFRGK